MEPIIIGVAALAILLIIMAKLAAQDTGVVIPTASIFGGGQDPAYIYLTASAAVTPGDNVEPVSTTRVKPCDASAEEFIGTADKNDDAVLDGNNSMTHDFAIGELVPVITGAVHVRKIAEGVIGVGKIVRPGTTAGTACLADATSTAKYTIGRNISEAVTDGNAFIMRQW